MDKPVTHIGSVEDDPVKGCLHITFRQGKKLSSFQSLFRDFVGKKVRITIEIIEEPGTCPECKQVYTHDSECSRIPDYMKPSSTVKAEPKG